MSETPHKAERCIRIQGQSGSPQGSASCRAAAHRRGSPRAPHSPVVLAQRLGCCWHAGLQAAPPQCPSWCTACLQSAALGFRIHPQSPTPKPQTYPAVPELVYCVPVGRSCVKVQLAAALLPTTGVKLQGFRVTGLGLRVGGACMLPAHARLSQDGSVECAKSTASWSPVLRSCHCHHVCLNPKPLTSGPRSRLGDAIMVQ